MNLKKESGVSTVVAFVMILAILAACVSIWAAVGVSFAAAEENEINTLKAEEFLTEYNMMLNTLRCSDFENPRVCMLTPLGSKYSRASLTLGGSNTGRFSVVKNGFEEVISCRVNGPVFKIGSYADVGTEGDGIFENTEHGGVWVVYPKFDIRNLSGKGLLVNLGDISYIKGDFSIGGTSEASFDTAYISSQNKEVSVCGVKDDKNPQNSFEENLTLVYEACSKTGAELRYSSFCDAYSKYLISGGFNSSKIYVEAPKISGNSVEMIFRSYDAPITLSLEEYIYEASPTIAGNLFSSQRNSG